MEGGADNPLVDPRVSAEIDRRIIDAMPGGMVYVGIDGDVLSANAEALRILGLSYDALTNRYTQDFAPETFHEDGSPFAPADYPVTRALLTGEAQLPETIGTRRPDGQMSWAIYTAVPVRSPLDGLVTGAVVTFLDMTARRRVEEQLRDSEARLRSIVDSVPAHVLTVDRALRVSFANRLTPGLAPESVIGASVLELACPDDRPMLAAALERTLADGSTESLELLADGWLGQGTYRVTAGPVRYGDEIRGATLVIDDITAQKAMEARLVLSDRLTAIGTLAAGVAHEINNPLTYLYGNLELLRRSWSAGPNAQRLRDAADGAERIREVVRDLMTFSHPEGDTLGPLQISEVIDRTERMARHEFKHRARFVRDEVPLPMVRGSKARLGQVLLNLLINAAHAIQPGRLEHNEIRVTTRRVAGALIRISVSDTGMGIERAMIGRIFDPFVTTKPTGQGTGLGLYVCHNIVRSLGGTIWVQSELGRGSTFHVDLPVHDEREHVTAESRPPAAAPLKRLRVLVVDDEPNILAFIQRTLAPHEVACVSSGAAAISALEGRAFDVVLCDVMMPDVTGLDVYEYTRQSAPELSRRFLFITGMALGELASSVSALGAPVLQKPFGVEELEHAMASVLA
jgi:two-component system cell cycle sensor histidine kinase/response regulator CckA